MGIAAPLGVSASGLPPLGDQANVVVSGIISAVGPTLPFGIRGPMNIAMWNAIATALTITSASLTASVASGTGITAGAAIKSTKVPRGTTAGAISGTTVTLAPPPVSLGCWGFSTVSPNIYVPAGCNAASLVGAAITIPQPTREQITLAAATVSSVVTADIPPANNSDGVPGVIALSATPSVVPPNIGTQPVNFAVGAAAIIAASGADAAATFTDAATKWSATVQLERSFDGGQTWLCCNIGGAGALAQYINLSSVQITFGEPEKMVLYRLNCLAYSSGTINWRISATGGAAESLAISSAI